MAIGDESVVYKRGLHVAPIQQAGEHSTSSKIKGAEKSRLQGDVRGGAVAWLVWLLALTATGLYLFTSGFLLTRLELDEYQTCAGMGGVLETRTAKRVDCSFLPQNQSSSNPIPSVRFRPFSKAVIIIIDALRFDFTTWTSGDLSSPSNATASSSYQNKLPLFHSLLSGQPQHSILFRARADPPTTTLQRLKAITTGNLPTFVDAGSNFASTAITDDNLIRQLRQAGHQLYFMGDDTWSGLYPTSFHVSHPFPSFDVWDLHSLDDGVIKHLFPTLAMANASAAEGSTWDVLVAHFLGVDHAGHRYGPEHSEMAAKLTQMNGILERVVETLDRDTLLLVLGDHGMDPKGDHGGDSENEVNAGMFLYSKRPLVSPIISNDSNNPANLLRQTLDAYDASLKPPYQILPDHRTISQIDIVPTLALLLGIPIPFGNLGSIIPELFLLPDEVNSNVTIASYQTLIHAARLNAQQVHRYLMAYAQKRPSTKRYLSKLHHLFEEAEDEYHSQMKVLSPDTVDHLIERRLQSVFLLYFKFTRLALAEAKKIWARFDIHLILFGAGILILSYVIFLIAAVRGFWAVQWNYGHIIIRAFLGALLCSIGNFRSLIHAEADSAFNRTHFMLLGATVGILSYLIPFFVAKPPLFSAESPKKLSKIKVLFGMSRPYHITLIPLTLHVLHAIATGSDSYTIHEDHVTVFLLQSWHAYLFVKALLSQQGQIMGYALVLALLTRISQLSTICRDEKLPFCVATFNAAPNSSIASPWSMVLLGLLLPILGIAMSAQFKRQSGISVGLFVGQLVLSFVYWTMDTMEARGILVPWMVYKVWVARSHFALGLVGLLMWVYKTSFPARHDDKSFSSDASVTMANATARKYWEFLGVSVFPLLLLVQKPMGGVMITLCMLQLLVMRRVILLHPEGNWGGLVGLSLLAQRYWFATGHQAALATIQYEVGFVGVKTVSWVVSPILVGLNTYASHILIVFSVPLLYMGVKSASSSSETWMTRCIGGLLSYLLLAMGPTLLSVLMAGHLRRHLMVWRVFAPKFIFTTVAFGSQALCVAGCLCVLGILSRDEKGGSRWSDQLVPAADHKEDGEKML